jgi:hypothetical protein
MQWPVSSCQWALTIDLCPCPRDYLSLITHSLITHSLITHDDYPRPAIYHPSTTTKHHQLPSADHKPLPTRFTSYPFALIRRTLSHNLGLEIRTNLIIESCTRNTPPA